MGVGEEDFWKNGAADNWFHLFTENVDSAEFLQSVIPLRYDDYEAIQATAQIMSRRGPAYIWPTDNFEQMEQIKKELVEIIEKRTNSPEIAESGESEKK